MATDDHMGVGGRNVQALKIVTAILRPFDRLTTADKNSQTVLLKTCAGLAAGTLLRHDNDNPAKLILLYKIYRV